MKTAVRREGPAPATKTGDRTRRFVLSDESVDRYNTTFKVDGWQLENYSRNPVVLWCHDHRSAPLGKATVSKMGSQLIAEVEFFDDAVNPDSPRLMAMIDAGVMGVSVGAQVLEAEWNEERESEDEWENWLYPPLDYTAAELLEMSVVNVPGNPNALPVRSDSAQELRLVVEGLAYRSADRGPVRPSADQLEKLRALRAAAKAKRSTPPVPADPESQALELEGLDADGVKKLVDETVNEVLADRKRASELRERGELEVA